MFSFDIKQLMFIYKIISDIFFFIFHVYPYRILKEMFNDERHMEKLSMLLYWHQHISITWVRCNLTSVLFLKRVGFRCLHIKFVNCTCRQFLKAWGRYIATMCTYFFFLHYNVTSINIQIVLTSLYNICSSYQ